MTQPPNRARRKLTAADKTLGVGTNSGQAKSMEIRKARKINRFDIDWTLPSPMNDNPLVWKLQVKGFLIDVRDAPGAVQRFDCGKSSAN